MARKPDWQFLKKVVSYVLVAVLSATAAFAAAEYFRPESKLDVLERLIRQRYIGQADETAMEDAAADAMVRAIGDSWSYYIPAAEYRSFEQDRENSYVGIGITIQKNADGLGFDVLMVDPNGPAKEAGMLPGDILIAAEGVSLAGMESSEAKTYIQGEEGIQRNITVLRDGEELALSMTLKKIQQAVAAGQLLEGNVGLVTIANFNDRCVDETIAAVEALLEEGAQKLIFDVRNNGGGYVDQLVKLLDYLLPEGILFQSVDYKGQEKVDRSGESCLEIPMAVLMNGRSYSAAEFFAAALDEYDWAVTVGENTSGKGYFQTAIRLPDGSAVNLSVGKYLTPKGVNLQEQGGLVPDVPVEVDEQISALIYGGLLPPEEDPQVQAAVEALS